jgi:hypothetical protein
MFPVFICHIDIVAVPLARSFMAKLQVAAEIKRRATVC